ncbi:MAG: glycosyltransferase family 2 protein [Candidatus Aenigmarchaeota archaeon]|nr:glycosyltransferase family 2 protein [Candidatus Aenigmarchaeota archaeon]
MRNLVSIVIAARNNADTLGQCIESLLSQTYKNTEIIVVNDGSTDNTARLAKRYPVKVVSIRHTIYGCSRPRRRGIGKAKGEFILIVDADAKYHPRYIERLIRHFKDRRIAAAAGRVIVWNPDTWITRCREVMYKVRFDDPANMEKEIKAGKIAAWFMRKKAYDEVGGHDRSIPHIGEDVDVTRRILKAGYNVVYEPTAFWRHKYPSTLKEVARRSFNYGRSAVHFYKKYPDEFSTARFLFSLSPLFIALLLLISPAIALVLLLIYLAVLEGQACRWFARAKGYKNRYYLLGCYAVIGTVGSFAHSLGVMKGVFSK